MERNIIKGNSVSSGITVGKIFLYKKMVYEAKEAYFQAGEVEENVKHFQEALNTAAKELDDIIVKLKKEDEEKAKIFQAHKEILEDEDMLDEINIGITSEHKCIDFAVYSVFEEFILLLSKAKDPLIAARTADLADVRNRLLRIIQNKKEQSLSSLTDDVIVAAHDLLPSDTATLDRSHVKGIITEVGGYTSHSAIIARSFQIPAILGVADAMTSLADGMTVILDAVTGNIILNPNEAMIAEGKAKEAEYKLKQERLEKYLNHPCKTKDGQLITIGINVGGKQFSYSLDSYDYVGLLRTEFLYMDSNHWPTEEEQFHAYHSVLSCAQGKTVTLRTLDIGGDKTLPYAQLPKEGNPFLGSRALRFCLHNPEIFLTQLRAALRASAYGNLQIMFPMVGSMEDIAQAKSMVETAKQQLRAENIVFNEKIKLGIMIEIPSIALLADLAAEEVDFASVGSNDLTQYVCAADRMNTEVTENYQNLSPAMLRILSYVFEQFNKEHKPISVCGEMAGNPSSAILLAGLGARKLSMSEANIASVKAAFHKFTIAEAEQLAKKCLGFATQGKIEEYLKVMI